MKVRVLVCWLGTRGGAWPVSLLPTLDSPECPFHTSQTAPGLGLRCPGSTSVGFTVPAKRPLGADCDWRCLRPDGSVAWLGPVWRGGFTVAVSRAQFHRRIPAVSRSWFHRRTPNLNSHHLPQHSTGSYICILTRGSELGVGAPGRC